MKSCYEVLTDFHLKSVFVFITEKAAGLVWKASIPFRIKALAWRSAINKLSTKILLFV